MGQQKKWVMPEWMKIYEKLIVNTGGNSVEELMNDQESTIHNNVVKVILCVAVKSQVMLLQQLYDKQLIK